MIRGFLFALAVLGIGIVLILPLIGSLVLIHRHTHRPAVFFGWLAGAVVYCAAASTGLAWIVVHSGLGAWVFE